MIGKHLKYCLVGVECASVHSTTIDSTYGRLTYIKIAPIHIRP